VANFVLDMDFYKSLHQNITLLSCLFCRIFVQILMILPLLLSFTNFLGLFIVADALGKYACLGRLFALLMSLLAEITLIYTEDGQS